MGVLQRPCMSTFLATTHVRWYGGPLTTHCIAFCIAAKVGKGSHATSSVPVSSEVRLASKKGRVVVDGRLGVGGEGRRAVL